MSSLGQTLREAREAKGLSQSKVAAETRILVQIVDDIENEDFRRIAAPIYGRGFVRLFAECVGLDPQPLIREFMDIYAGRRAPTVHVREVPTAADPLPAAEPPQGVQGLDLFDPPVAGTPPAPPRMDDSPFLPPSFDGNGPSAADRFRTGLSSVSHGVLQSMRQIPRSAWRKVVLALLALAVVALIVFGCSKLYQMTTPPPPPACADGACEFTPPAKATPAAKTAQPPAAKKGPVKLRATGQKIPSLYAD